MTRQNPKFFPGNKQIFSHDPKAIIFKEKSQKKFRGFFFRFIIFIENFVKKISISTMHKTFSHV